MSQGSIEVSARAQQVLGANGVARLSEFLSYANGWDFGGGGVALAPQSITAMERFLAAFDGFGKSQPSLFLSRDGHLILAWEDAQDEGIEIELTDEHHAILYLDVFGDEGRSYNLSEEITELIEAIPKPLAAYN